MTRFLSELLGAQEPGFSLMLKQLEGASGQNASDIRLSVDIRHSAQRAVKELGLDPHDTTLEELYAMLQERLKNDNQALLTKLGVSAEVSNQEIIDAVHRLLAKEFKHVHTFVLKPSSARRLLRQNPPKKVLKQLRYRSLESMLKHEAPADLYAAANLCEEDAWHKTRRQQYASLSSTDFEVGKLAITQPKSAKWQNFAQQRVGQAKHNVLAFPELGTIILLPVPEKPRVRGLALITLALSLHAANDIAATTSLLKMQQVRPDFGTVVADMANGSSFVAARLADQPLSWNLVHRYFAELKSFPAHLFEPHVQPEDLHWQHVEAALGRILPSLTFWEPIRYAGLVEDGKTVSLNLLDNLLSFCNRLPFASAVGGYGREHAFQELMLRYIHPENIEHSLASNLVPELEFERIT